MYPTSYVTRDAITCTPMIKQIKKIYLYGNLFTYQFEFYAGITLSYNPSNHSITAAIELPPYVISYGDYLIKYLFITADITLLRNDFPRYQFQSNMISLGVGTTAISYNPGVDLFHADNNIFFGISQYDLFNKV